MILFLSHSGESLPIVWRLQNQGVHAGIYVHAPRYRSNYDGLMEKIPLAKIRSAVNKAKVVVFDIVRPNEKTKQDLALLKAFRANQKAPEVFGAIADKIKRERPVMGASGETATWELDRNKGAEIARKVGIKTPASHDFERLSEGAKFLEGKSKRYVFKPHDNQDLDLTYVEKYPGELKTKMQGEYKERLDDRIDYLLQEVVDGIEVSTECFFDGQDFIHFNHTIEDKKLMNSNLGPAIGSQGNTVWIKKNPNGLLVPELKRLKPMLQQAGYIGPIDANCIVAEKDHKPYFLEWSPRWGWDAFFCLLSLVDGSLATIFEHPAKTRFHEGYASSQRITIPPFPYSDKGLLQDFAEGVAVEHEPQQVPNFWMEDVRRNGKSIECAGADGIVGVMAARGNSLGGSVGNMYRSVDKLRIASTLMYRTDGGRRCEKAIKQLEKWGVTVG